MQFRKECPFESGQGHHFPEIQIFVTKLQRYLSFLNIPQYCSLSAVYALDYSKHLDKWPAIK